MPENPYYPPVAFYFEMNVIGISGSNKSSFQEVSGLDVNPGVAEPREGGENRFVNRLPAPPKYDNLVLKRGMLVGSPLITWATTNIAQFKFDAKTLIVNLLDENANPLATWKFINAYPVGIKLSDLKGQDNCVVVETLELSYQSFSKVF